MSKLPRRKFLTTAGGAFVASLALNSCQQNNPTPTPTDNSSNNTSSPTTTPQVNSGATDTPETDTVKLGFIPVMSGAPLVIAQVKGLYAKYGMTKVELAKQSSWGTFRDNLVLGSQGGGVDGGHLLSNITYNIATGEITNGQKVPMYILARLNLNGQGVTVSNAYKDLKLSLDSTPLKEVFAKAKAGDKEIKCSVPFPRVTGDFFMRWWLEAGGIMPEKDTEIMVVPPAQAVANMKVGNMEAFSLVEPWHAQAVKIGIGYTAVTSGELWNDHPEKAFMMRSDWVDQNPQAAKALLMAIQEAQIWCDKMENKQEMCDILSQDQWYKISVDLMLDRAMGKFDYGNGRVVENSPHLIKYWSNNASYPYKSHDLWGLVEDMRWGFRPKDTDINELKKIVNQVNREDIWKEAAKAIGQESIIPASTSRGVETFFNGRKFDPENPLEYLNS
jgi:nitrate/nitrite transport system substrate-binding protein